MLEQELGASIYGSALAATAIGQKTEVWHNRLGHVSHSALQTLIKSGGVEGLDGLKADNTCEGCIYGKARRNPFGDSIGTEYHAKEILGRVHADFCGPINLNLEGDPMTLLYDPKYILMLVDEKSRMIFGSILSKKSEAEDYIITWCNQVMTETGKAIKEFHCDGGTEFR